MSLLLALLGCGVEPYPDYFEAGASGPTLDAVSPATVAGTTGGMEVTLTGARLGQAQVVTFGSRNAEILEATDTSLRVRAPAFPPGGGAVEVAVATESGIARLEGGFTYTTFGSGWWDNEDLSLVVANVDCPVEAWLSYDGEPVPSLWCGIEQGFTVVRGWDGAQRDPGMAANLAGVGDLGALPAPGEVQVWRAGDPVPPTAPLAYKSVAEDAWISLEATRRGGGDLAFVQDRIAMLERWYSGWDAVVTEPELWLRGYVDDPGVCWEEWFILDAAQSGYEIDGDATGISAFEGVLWFQEEIDGEVYDVEGVFFSGEVSDAGDGFVEAAPSGATAFYDAWSGGFEGWAARGDARFDQRYRLFTQALGEITDLGDMAPGVELTGLEPELMSGAVRFEGGADLGLRWDPIPVDDTALSAVVVELRVFQGEVPDPNAWLAPVRVIRVRGDDLVGEASIPASALEGLGPILGALDDNGDLIGLHAELTVARHTLRRVPIGEGSEAVVDFVHAVQAPVTVGDP